MTDWRWLQAPAISAFHDASISHHGGQPGLRDAGLLESAIARPQQKAAYGDPDIFELAAAYAFGLARNHPFLDGNKRVALISAVVFIELNGWRFSATEAEAAIQTLSLAAGEMDESDYAAWLRDNSEET